MDFAGGETRIALNGQAKGAVAGEPFNAALMRIWLADKPVQADLKKAMLGA
jgi:long-chain acyl-CoA synthetase